MKRANQPHQRSAAMVTGCNVWAKAKKLGVLWECDKTQHLRPDGGPPRDRAAQRLLARVVPETPAPTAVRSTKWLRAFRPSCLRGRSWLWVSLPTRLPGPLLFMGEQSSVAVSWARIGSLTRGHLGSLGGRRPFALDGTIDRDRGLLCCDRCYGWQRSRPSSGARCAIPLGSAVSSRVRGLHPLGAEPRQDFTCSRL